MADSSGIGLLMATYNSMRKIGGRFGGRQCFQ
jgi:anti-anti-sigma regulatory factor